MTTRTQIDIYSHIADKWIARYGAVAPGHLEPDRRMMFWASLAERDESVDSFMLVAGDSDLDIANAYIYRKILKRQDEINDEVAAIMRRTYSPSMDDKVVK